MCHRPLLISRSADRPSSDLHRFPFHTNLLQTFFRHYLSCGHNRYRVLLSSRRASVLVYSLLSFIFVSDVIRVNITYSVFLVFEEGQVTLTREHLLTLLHSGTFFRFADRPSSNRPSWIFRFADRPSSYRPSWIFQFLISGP